MIRKLNTPTAMFLVVCLSLAPTVLAADHAPRGWFTELIQTVKAFITGADTQPASQERGGQPKPQMRCGGEHGPIVEPGGPGCGG